MATPAHADEPSPSFIPTWATQKDQAQDPPRNADPWSSRPRAVNVQGASGGPLGYGGLSFEYAPTNPVVVEAVLQVASLIR